MIFLESQRVRIIRVLLNLGEREFAAKVGVHLNTARNWERGRSTPNRAARRSLETICESEGITFTASGLPVPVSEIASSQSIIHKYASRPPI